MAKKKLKIAFLNITQGRINRGGEVFVKELARRLSKNHSVDIISGQKTLPKRWPVLWRFFVDPQGLLIAVFTIKNLPQIWKKKYDFVIPVDGGWQPALVRLTTWAYGGKMVISGQSGIGWDDRNNLWSFPDHFVAISSKAVGWAKKANPLRRGVVYIPNGVDLKKFNSKGPKHKTKLKPPIVLCAGALVSEKRIELTIKAVSKLENVSLLIAGDGPLKEKIITLGKKLFKNKFELISVNHNQMPGVYRSADLFTFTPAHSEAFGIVYIEALAANLPVVAIDDPQRREIIGNAGSFVKNPKDHNKYANILQKALQTNWGNKPRRQAEKFSWDKIAVKYEHLFSNIIK